jgi:hypothetical protein
MIKNTTYFMSLVEKCRQENENDIGQRVGILEVINSSLPINIKLVIPSLITNTCVDNILSALEVTLLPPIYGHF